MTNSMARQEGNALALERAEHKLVGRIAERSLDGDLVNVGQLGHLIKPAAADDSNFRCAHQFSASFFTLFSAFRLSQSLAPMADPDRDRTNRSNSLAPLAGVIFSSL